MAFKVGQRVVADAAKLDGDRLNARLSPNGKVGSSVKAGYTVKITQRKYAGGRWWIKGTKYWYAEDFFKLKSTASGGGGGKAPAKVKSPVPGYRVTTPYGKRKAGLWRTKGYHTGDDYAAPRNASVVAVRSGRVYHRSDSVLGVVALLYADNGKTYWYCHLNFRTVKNGAKVKAGQIIGKVGATGSGALGNHLHFEMHSGHTTSWWAKDAKPTW